MLVVRSLACHRGSKRGGLFLIEIRRCRWGAEVWKLSGDGEVLGGRAVVETARCGLAGHRGWSILVTVRPEAAATQDA